jgi:anaerobic ribonucleoside-triphosphate reductase activating protein
MRIHRYLSLTTVNGPGKRFTLWMQGCLRNCEGCFNPQTHNPDGGTEIPAEKIVTLIPKDIDGITISGGEPFDQAAELSKFLELVSIKKLHCLIYTGYRYEELKAMKSQQINRCLELTDILIDGEYKQRIPQKHFWAGSGNQRILILEHGAIVQELRAEEEIFYNEELIVDNDGNIIATGFVDSRLFAFNNIERKSLNSEEDTK